MCLGIAPFDAWCWVIPKAVLYDHVIGQTPQHRGKEGTDTFWFSVRPEKPLPWLEPYGGSLSRAFERLHAL